jgi:hypothetical protein
MAAILKNGSLWSFPLLLNQCLLLFSVRFFVTCNCEHTAHDQCASYKGNGKCVLVPNQCTGHLWIRYPMRTLPLAECLVLVYHVRLQTSAEVCNMLNVPIYHYVLSFNGGNQRKVILLLFQCSVKCFPIASNNVLLLIEFEFSFWSSDQ